MSVVCVAVVSVEAAVGTIAWLALLLLLLMLWFVVLSSFVVGVVVGKGVCVCVLPEWFPLWLSSLWPMLLAC